MDLPTAPLLRSKLQRPPQTVRETQAPQKTAPPAQVSESLQPTTLNTTPVTAKIIEFPRSWTPPAAPVDELAEPVIDLDRPRILEAPEVVPPPPALGGITIEPAQQPDMEKRPGIDIPLQSAPLGRRIFAAAIDGIFIAAACVMFGFIFWKMTAIRPPQFQILGIAAGLSSIFWAAYQYLARGLLRHYARIAASAAAIGPLRRKSRPPPSPPLAHPRFISLSRLSRHGIRLGFPRRRLALLARPHHAYLSRAEAEVSPVET